MAYLGDVPASSLWKTIIDTRETLAALRMAHNVYDAFVVPAGLVRTSDGPDGGNTGNVLASKITAEILGVPFTSIHNVKRAQWNAAIAEMNRQIQQLQSPTGVSGSVAPQQPVTTSPSPISPVTAPGGVVSPVAATTTGIPFLGDMSGNNTLLMLAGGLGLYFLINRNKSAPARMRTRKGKRRHASR